MGAKKTAEREQADKTVDLKIFCLLRTNNP